MLIFLEKYIRYWFVIEEERVLNMDTHIQFIKQCIIELLEDEPDEKRIGFIHGFLLGSKKARENEDAAKLQR